MARRGRACPTSESDADTDGISGTTNGAWVDLTATVPDGTNALRWEYRTDGGVALSGFQVDNITLDGTDIGNAETDAGWTFDGFRITTGTEDRRSSTPTSWTTVSTSAATRC